MPKRYVKKSRYPRDKKGKLNHLQVVKRRGDYRVPGFHEVHHKDDNPRNYRSKNLELMYKGEHRLHHEIKRKEKRLKKYKFWNHN